MASLTCHSVQIKCPVDTLIVEMDMVFGVKVVVLMKNMIETLYWRTRFLSNSQDIKGYDGACGSGKCTCGS